MIYRAFFCALLIAALFRNNLVRICINLQVKRESGKKAESRVWNCDCSHLFLSLRLLNSPEKRRAVEIKITSLIYLFNLCVVSGREIRALRTRNLMYACGLSFSWRVFIFAVISDENRDLNGHTEDDIKRNRTQYNGDPLYANVS